MMQLKITLLLFVSVLFYNSNYAQSKSFEWATSYGGKTAVQSFSIATDASGNTYSTGFFSDTVDFDPNAGVRALTSQGGTDIFLMKLNQNGSFAWAVSFGGTSRDEGLSLTTDKSGNVYVAGLLVVE